MAVQQGAPRSRAYAELLRKAVFSVAVFFVVDFVVDSLVVIFLSAVVFAVVLAVAVDFVVAVAAGFRVVDVGFGFLPPVCSGAGTAHPTSH